MSAGTIEGEDISGRGPPAGEVRKRAVEGALA
jgi:hypothetical protein